MKGACALSLDELGIFWHSTVFWVLDWVIWVISHEVTLPCPFLLSRATIHSVASQVGFAGRSAVAEATSPDPKTKVSSAGFGRLWRWHHSASYSLYGFIYGFIRILRSRSLSVFQKHDQERFWTILDNNPGTSHLNRSFSKEWGVPWVFCILHTFAFACARRWNWYVAVWPTSNGFDFEIEWRRWETKTEQG